jgi:phospholipase/lecithinase/hemolysin
VIYLRQSIVRLALFVAVIAAPTSVLGQVPKYDALIVFGDSISDTGNAWMLTKSAGIDPALPPSESPHKTYFRGRFSNGPVMFEHLWGKLNANGGSLVPSLAITQLPPRTAVSFAFGTSGTDANCVPVPGLLCQVALFAQSLNGAQPSKRTLYAIFSGGTDVLSAPNPFDPAVVAGVVTHVSQAVQQLYQLGARDVIVVNIPNLGLAPLIAAPELKVGLDHVSQLHNAALASALSALSATLPGIRIILVDAYSHVQSLVAASAFDFVTPALDPINSYCLFDGAVPTGINCHDVPTFNVDRSYFFWDVEHPTKAAHANLGGFIYRTLTEFFAR